jgi:predicted AAA+ superfamily ATPase
MRHIPDQEVSRRMRSENVWWGETSSIGSDLATMKRRAYFDLLYPLVKNVDVKRAVLLMGPRRVGKTVLLHHVIDQLIRDGVPPFRICYLSVDHPLYNDCDLGDLLDRFLAATGTVAADGPVYVFFDEIQYFKNWEVHLKTLVDSHPSIKFVASGSAAAALKLKSTESGAGRFTDFLLPPLTFYEYLLLLELKLPDSDTGSWFKTDDLETLNKHFVHYLNYGGYPEVLFSSAIQRDLARFIKSDIIDKVLLRDLPSLYGIHDIQELNSLFTSLAFNTANEVSLIGLSQNSGVAKNTIKRYLEYLEAAFLIRAVHRIDRSGKRFQRANFFKVYLTNPSIRSALFSPLTETDDAMGDLVETGAYSQWFHSSNDSFIRYARWDGGEVDVVWCNETNAKPGWGAEIKWSDRYVDQPGELDSLLSFCKANRIDSALVTSKTRTAVRSVDGVTLMFRPASLYCYSVGYNIIKGKKIKMQVA